RRWAGELSARGALGQQNSPDKVGLSEGRPYEREQEKWRAPRRKRTGRTRKQSRFSSGKTSHRNEAARASTIRSRSSSVNLPCVGKLMPRAPQSSARGKLPRARSRYGGRTCIG